MTAKRIGLAYSRPKVRLAAKTGANDPLKPVHAGARVDRAAGHPSRKVRYLVSVLAKATDLIRADTMATTRDGAAAIAVYSGRFPETQLNPINTSYGDGAMQRMWRLDIRQR